MTLTDFFPEITWGQVVYYLFLLAAGYLLLWLAPLLVRWLTRPGRARRRWLEIARTVRTAYEPVAIILAIVVLVCVNPLLDGLILIALLVLGWSSIRNYIDGQVLRLSSALREGKEISVAGHTGAVHRMNALALVLRTEDGDRVIPYRTLRQEGFTLSRGARISGIHEYYLSPESEPAGDATRLRNLLFNCPYLNWRQRPEIRATDAGRFHVRVMLQSERYADGFLQLVREWDYTIEEKL